MKGIRNDANFEKNTNLQLEYIREKIIQMNRKHHTLLAVGSVFSELLGCMATDEPVYHIYIVVHCLDSPPLRTEQTFAMFAKLASTPNIHFIASVENFSSMLLFDHTMLQQFNFSYIHSSYFSLYARETSQLEVVDTKDDDMVTGVLHIIQTLPETQKKILLLQMQIKYEHPRHQGLTFAELKEIVKEKRIQVTFNDQQLKNMLAEFVDSKVLKKKEIEGSTYYCVPYAPKALLNILNA